MGTHSPETPAGMDGQRTDLDRYLEAQNVVSDRSLDSTRNMVRMGEESSAAGGRTLGMLEQQGEQLDRIEAGVSGINANMVQVGRHLTSMEKWGGMFTLPWKRQKKMKEESKATWETSKEKAKAASSPQTRTTKEVEGGRYIEVITGDAREEEMEDNLVVVGVGLSNLKMMAGALGAEIERQNGQLEVIGAKADVASVNVDRANKRTNKLNGK